MDSTFPTPPPRPLQTAEEILDDLSWLSRAHAEMRGLSAASNLRLIDSELMKHPAEEVLDIALRSSALTQANMLICLNSIVDCRRRERVCQMEAHAVHLTEGLDEHTVKVLSHSCPVVSVRF